MGQYGVYANLDGKASIVSVNPSVIGTGPGQLSLEECIQRSVPEGVPYGIFEYPSEAYPVDFDVDNWYPTPEETSTGIGTLVMRKPEPPPGGYTPEPEEET